MPYTYKIAKINTNGKASRIRLTMLEEYLKQQDIEIALLQEVTNTNLTTLRRYNTHINVGIENKGTAILAKEGLILTNTTRLPSGRGMATRLEGIQTINISTVMEEMEQSEERKEQQNYTVRSEATPETTSDDDVTKLLSLLHPKQP